ncbi:type II secretion system F family protein [Alteribacillus iranensis]|uniref:Tight adherence protein C n=1 Tax=Alteribacillus iranensis TaxID=930128 RepID=A0A1I2EV75_9BACI|nr:type II secretion system F family protein [Alteribacillus iranensis]SFE96517.1 tight adherence protein C [Alteribacillus iranensis]
MFIVTMSFFLFISLCFYIFFAYRYDKQYVIQRRIDTYFHSSRVSSDEMEEDFTFFQRVIEPGWKKFKRTYQRRISRERTSQLERKLQQAGRPFSWSSVEFQLFQFGLLIGLPVLTVVLSILVGQSVFVTFFITFCAAIFGLFMPRYYINMKIKNRVHQALRELPDTLDLLTISLEAGLGFDAALSKVVSRRHGILSDEFRVCLDELRLGRTRKEALQGISERLSFDELNAFIYNVVQAEKLGIGIVSVLKVQAEDVRNKRRQRAEEAAMQAPIKMLFPLVLFIFPTIFIVVLGPAILQFMEAF